MERNLLQGLGDRIRLAREQAGMQQVDLAVAVGLKGGSAIGNYENATREPSLSTLASIAAATRVRYAWLVAGALPMLEMAGVREGEAIYDASGNRVEVLSPEDAAQLEVLRALPPDLRAHIRALGDALAKPPETQRQA